MARHGTTISDDQVNTLRQLFKVLDRGGDPRTIMRSDHVRRFRATLERIHRDQRLPRGRGEEE